MSLLFGMYPGSKLGADTGELVGGPADVPERIAARIAELRGAKPFLVRAYVIFRDEEGDPPIGTENPIAAEQYAADGCRLDLVVQYQSRNGNVDGYRRFVERVVEHYDPVLETIQITEEPNMTGNPTLDGDYPGVRDAIIAGVRAARRAAAHVKIGVNSTPLFGPAESFFAELAELGGPAFLDELDYIGLDMFPDVFHPVPDPGAATRGLLAHHRDNVLARAGLDRLPLHITENGWPTGPSRSPQRQAEVLDAVISAAAQDPGVAAYTLFALRDADSSADGLFHRFGVLTDSYEPKPAFHRYRELIGRHGRDYW